MPSLSEILESIGRQPQWLGALALLAAAFLEYVVPPIPGDAICLFGAFLVGRAGWSLPLVFVAVMAGTGLGMLFDYRVGVWLRRRVERGREGGAAPSPRLRSVLALEDRYRHRAALTLVSNRFLPGIRAFLFVGAGFFGYPLGRTLLWGFVSALAWNGLIFLAGVQLGVKYEQLSDWMSQYMTVVWVLLGVATVGLGVRWWLRRRSASRGTPAPPPG
ncbi:MAG: VTT domain-containing protein [Deltaproteobacteria bacterium]|nr:VTT domain-containing protein [Deltaproteobacteria bacterium]